MRKVRGIGINDTELSGPSCTVRDEFGKKTVYLDYRTWYAILVRATDDKSSYYKEVAVCQDWFIRSNFQKWYLSHETLYDSSGNILEVDKDILISDNTIYSPQTCALVPQYLNVAFNTGADSKHGTPMWVRYRKRNPDMKNDLKKPYRAVLTKENGKYIHLGYFKYAKDAHNVARQYKIGCLKETLIRYSLESCYREDVYNAAYRRILKLEDEATRDVFTVSI